MRSGAVFGVLFSSYATSNVFNYTLSVLILKSVLYISVFSIYFNVPRYSKCYVLCFAQFLYARICKTPLFLTYKLVSFYAQKAHTFDFQISPCNHMVKASPSEINDFMFYTKNYLVWLKMCWTCITMDSYYCQSPAYDSYWQLPLFHSKHTWMWNVYFCCSCFNYYQTQAQHWTQVYN